MGWIWILFPAGTREIFILKGVQTGSRFHPASHLMGTGTFYRGTAAEAHLQLGPSLRKSGALPLLSLCAFMVWKVTTLLCYTITCFTMIPYRVILRTSERYLSFSATISML
jgi:hypothetical protein